MKRVVPIVRAIVFAISLILLTQTSFSQSITTGNGKIEIGLGLGPSFFLGDLGGGAGEGKTFIKDVDIPLVKLSKGLYVNIFPAEWLGFRIAGNLNILEGSDAAAPDKGGAEIYRKNRNLSFKTNIVEGYVATEFYPTVFIEQYDGLAGKIRPYGVIGVGLFHFNPKTQDTDGSWVELKPLHTEGQGFAEYPDRKEYPLTQLEVPLGFGVKYYLRDNFYVGVEVLHRKLFTDYVDDVSTNYIDPLLFANYLPAGDAATASRLYYRGDEIAPNTRPALDEQRGDPIQNDAYFSTIVRLGWRLNGSDSPNGRAAKQLRCPKFY